MKNELSLAQVQRSMLLRSIYLLVAPLMLVFEVLACGTLVTDIASYTCPTSVPQATATTLAGTPMPTLPPLPTPYNHYPTTGFLRRGCRLGRAARCAAASAVSFTKHPGSSCWLTESSDVAAGNPQSGQRDLRNYPRRTDGHHPHQYCQRRTNRNVAHIGNSDGSGRFHQ